jgi:hypothetical protein
MRNISPAMQQVIDSGFRRPAYRIFAWDPTATTISKVVCAIGILTDPGPVDLTAYASDLSWTDKQLSFSLVDPSGFFHPDFGEYRNYLKDQAIIRLVEGDETVDEAGWVITFTGQIHGQIGWKKSRKTGEKVAKVTVYGRNETQAFKRRKITSDKYTVGTDLGVALYDICSTFMGLTVNEMRIPYTLGRQFQHQTNQLCQVTPWDAISSLLEVVCYQPFFDGEGKLSYINKSLNRPAAYYFEEEGRIAELEIPERSQDSINKVTVTFLDSQLERKDSAYQKLGGAQVTTGFFSMHETLPCWWSDDHKQRANGTNMVVIKSVNSGILPVGTESYSQIDDFHGKIEVEISVWVPILATVMVLDYLAAALIPDYVASVILGVTIPWGRVIQALDMIAILLIMMSIGSAQYEIYGTPFDYAYLEKKSIAIEDGLEYWLENNLDIKNDFIGTHDQADIIATTELIWQKCLAAPRKVALIDDLRLEVGDIIGQPDGRKMVIAGMSKTIKRGEVPTLILEGSKVLTA